MSDINSQALPDAGGPAGLPATNRNGRVIEYDYDNLQRLVQELWKDGITTENTIDYTYDAASQLTAIADDQSAYAYTYDGLGRVTEVDNAGTSVGPNVVFLSTYNAAGWRTSNRAVVDGTNDFINTYNYDNLGQSEYVQQVEHGTGNSVAEKRVDFAYNAAGQYESITRYTDITQNNLVAATTFSYDDAHRLTGLSHDQGLTNLADYAWTFDTAGRLTSVTTVDGTDDYTYDDNGQLLDVDSDYQTDETYTYDANGNRTLAGYTTGDNNRLTSDGTSNYEYDAEGNRTKKTEISSGDYVEYNWDHRNRLTSVTFRDSSDAKLKEVTYVYDVFDRRIARDVDDDGNGSIDRGERYVYDGSDVALVYDESDLLVERLLYGPGVDQPLASEDAAGDVLWFLADNQGSIRDVAEYDDTSNTTSVVNHIQYGGFGNITSQTDPSKEPRHTYTGREWDADSELFYYRARWYDPVVGRFISEDPIGFSAGDANLSRYVGNSTTNYVDPSGLIEVRVDADAFIPYAWITHPSGIGQLKGDNRNVSQSPGASSRVSNYIVVELDAEVNPSSTPIVDKDHHIASTTWKVSGRSYVDTGSGTHVESAERIDARTVKVTLAWNGAHLPLWFGPGAPGIDYHLEILLTQESPSDQDCEGPGYSYRILSSSAHDGFPAYEFYVGGKLVDSHDPRVSGEGPASLLPPAEHSPVPPPPQRPVSIPSVIFGPYYNPEDGA